MPVFKVHQRADQYSECLVTTETKEAALAQALDSGVWKFVEVQAEEIIGIDELNAEGNAIVYHYLEENIFVDEIEA